MVDAFRTLQRHGDGVLVDRSNALRPQLLLEGRGCGFRHRRRTADDSWHAEAIVDQPQRVRHAHVEGRSIEIDKQSSNERPFERARPFSFFGYG